MVQMKAYKSIKTFNLTICLYIPHGSDERKCFRFRKADVLALYIPHGSDESHTITILIRLKIVFISHMVQMKVCVMLVKFLMTMTFISHMVQMKVVTLTYPEAFVCNFISHMVQMKGLNLSRIHAFD